MPFANCCPWRPGNLCDAMRGAKHSCDWRPPLRVIGGVRASASDARGRAPRSSTSLKYCTSAIPKKTPLLGAYLLQSSPPTAFLLNCHHRRSTGLRRPCGKAEPQREEERDVVRHPQILIEVYAPSLFAFTCSQHLCYSPFATSFAHRCFSEPART